MMNIYGEIVLFKCGYNNKKRTREKTARKQEQKQTRSNSETETRTETETETYIVLELLLHFEQVESLFTIPLKTVQALSRLFIYSSNICEVSQMVSFSKRLTLRERLLKYKSTI